MRRAGMAIGRRAQQWMICIYALAPPTYTAYMVYTRYRWVGLGGFGLGCQWLAGLVSRVWLYVIWMGGAGGGGLGMGCQWLAGLVSRVCLYDRGEIMIGSSDNSGGVVVGALVCGTECS